MARGSSMMYTTNELIKRGRIPEPYSYLISTHCKCTYPILRNIELTQAICSNPRCEYHMKYKASKMFDYLKVKGLGPQRCGMYIKRHRVRNHLILVKHILNYKPRLYLWEIALLAGIPGYSSQLEEMMIGYNSFYHYYAEEKSIPLEVKKYREILIEAQEYFEVKPSLAKDSINIMITGSVPGFSPRKEFVNFLNDHVGDVIRVKLVGDGVKDRDYLVTTNPYTMTGKVNTALENGINIIHPTVFLDILYDVYKEKKFILNNHINMK